MSSVTATTAANSEGRPAHSGLAGLDSASAERWLIYLRQRLWRNLSLYWLDFHSNSCLSSQARESAALQTTNWKWQHGNIWIWCDIRGLTGCSSKRCLANKQTHNHFWLDANSSTIKLCWGWTVFTSYTQSIIKIVRSMQIHLRSGNTVITYFKCTAASGYTVLRSIGNPHLNAASFITNLHHTV